MSNRFIQIGSNPILNLQNVTFVDWPNTSSTRVFFPNGLVSFSGTDASAAKSFFQQLGGNFVPLGDYVINLDLVTSVTIDQSQQVVVAKFVTDSVFFTGLSFAPAKAFFENGPLKANTELI